MELRYTNLTFTGDVLGERSPGQLKTQVRVITLRGGEHLKHTLYNVEKGWIIVFRLGPNLYGREISIYTNHPEFPEKDFNRKNYRELKWCQEFRPEFPNKRKYCKDFVKCYAQVPIRQAGCFNYYFVERKGESIETLGSGHFTVNPILPVGGPGEKLLHIDSIQCQTVLTKCLGKLDEWPNRVLVSKKCRYNAIHFTPVQELGSSNSSYSIKDHFKINPNFGEEDENPTVGDISHMMRIFRQEWKILCISDVVLNHTSNESPWLMDHPECTYNMVNSPHLIPAAILDGYLKVFSRKVSEGAYTAHGIPRVITNGNDVQAIKFFLETELFRSIRLQDYFECDVDKIAAEFKVLMRTSEPTSEPVNMDDLKLMFNHHLGRKKTTVDMDLVLKLFNRKSLGALEETVRRSNCVLNLISALHEINAVATRILREHLKVAAINVAEVIRYQRVRRDGPMIREISENKPLVPRYFTGKFKDYKSIEEEIFKNGQYIMAHNGWVFNSDPMKNFAASDSDVYIRRELNVWDDSVKLRYGDSPDDCPYLWNYMRRYVEMTAEMFHGFRLDNCHSTPLAVGEYMMDCARKVNPDIYITAELFTDSDDIDIMYMNRLGITAVIREETRAPNTEELARLLYRYGGEPVGNFYKSHVRELVPGTPRAIFYDVTHDNESHIQKRNVFNCIPCAALLSMACCATGSTRGFDEFVPHKIDVVEEKRLYRSWSKRLSPARGEVNEKFGFIKIKKKFNMIHEMLSNEGYSEIFIDQMDEDIITVTRHNPSTHDGVILIAYPSYTYPDNTSTFCEIKKLKFEGQITNILIEASIGNMHDRNYFGPPRYYNNDPDYINGYWEYKTRVEMNIPIELSAFVAPINSEDPSFSEYELKNFLPGSIVIAETRPKSLVKPRVDFMIGLANSLAENNCQSLVDASSTLTLEDLNFVLYYCSNEGLEAGCGSYHIPAFGSLIYCGLQGFVSVLEIVKRKQDLGHPFCQNLRHGDWMLDYISGRFKNNPNTESLGLWFEEVFECLKHLPRFLIPRYFDFIVNSVVKSLKAQAISEMSPFVTNGSSFVTSLALGSIQCIGHVESATLPNFPVNPKKSDDRLKKVTMCAGLPHFSSGYMRSWGRDTFIALRGLMLLTGRHDVARCHILGYASFLQQGLIPNLLNSGINPRYNSRDAIWWWLYSIISYVRIFPSERHLIHERIVKFPPKKDSPPTKAALFEQPLHFVMQEALTHHFQGLQFKEKNAGPSLDEDMTEAGFSMEFGIDLVRGFVYGGNEHNCGTWMDKMGSSTLAGNRGKPATPRDGSAVELVGLCKRVLRELAELYDIGYYPYFYVTRVTAEGGMIKWTFKEWGAKIGRNFEKYFWVDENPSGEETDSDVIHRRGIYKDTFGATQRWADYQLRCNFPITLTLAPELVDPEKAWKALEKAEELLLGPLGIKTLDPADWNYNGDYHNDDQSNNPKVAQGFNYHQGPEWIWPVGYLLRAKLHFAKLRGPEELDRTIKKIWAHLGRLYEKLICTQWKGLPELTNSNGSHCPGSCNVQAWSMGCILEVLYDLHELELTPEKKKNEQK